MALFATTICSTAVIAQVADIVKHDQESKKTYDYSVSAFILLGTIGLWFGKFFIGVAWYRMKLQTNVIKHTLELFYVRTMADTIMLLAIPIPLMVFATDWDIHRKHFDGSSYNHEALMIWYICLESLSVIVMEILVYHFCVVRARD